MATKKSMGSSRNGRDSHSKRLGIKRFANEAVQAGSILVRQRGTKYRPGLNVRKGNDFTLYSIVNGIVFFTLKEKSYIYVNVVEG